MLHPVALGVSSMGTVQGNGHATIELVRIPREFLMEGGQERAIPHISHCAK
jgi:hypothetical protein